MRTGGQSASVHNGAPLCITDRSSLLNIQLNTLVMARKEIVEIDLADVQSLDRLHDMLMTSLDFPGWYGKNWDAFWDGITGLVEMPITLRLSGWSQFAKRFPRDAKIMRECLNDMSKEYPEIASKVVYV